MAEHKVVIEVVNNRARIKGGKKEVKVAAGDFVRFVSEAGLVRIAFPSPLGGRVEIDGNAVHQVGELQGRFPFNCGVTLKSGKTIGWPDSPGKQQGGDVVVERPRSPEPAD